jgi:hypothetical protein
VVTKKLLPTRVISRREYGLLLAATYALFLKWRTSSIPARCPSDRVYPPLYAIQGFVPDESDDALFRQQNWNPFLCFDFSGLDRKSDMTFLPHSIQKCIQAPDVIVDGGGGDSLHDHDRLSNRCPAERFVNGVCARLLHT